MPNYAPELVASVLHQYVHTDKPIAQIAADHAINERDVTRIRHAADCPARAKRVREIPPAMRLLLETTEQLKAAAPASDDSAVAMDSGLAATRRPGMTETEAPLFSDVSVIARIERLIGEELAAQEATRASLGALARAPSEADRCAKTLSILTQTLHTLMRLRAGASPEQAVNADDDIPEDIDEFRFDLARRIEAFLASRPADPDDAGDPAAAPLDEARA